MNQSTKSLQYDGAVLNTVMTMAELAHGGQILIDEASFTTVKAGLVQLRARVAPSPNLAGLHSLCRQDSCADAAKLAACIMFQQPRQLCLQAIDAKSPRRAEKAHTVNGVKWLGNVEVFVLQQTSIGAGRIRQS